MFKIYCLLGFLILFNAVVFGARYLEHRRRIKEMNAPASPGWTLDDARRMQERLSARS